MTLTWLALLLLLCAWLGRPAWGSMHGGSQPDAAHPCIAVQRYISALYAASVPMLAGAERQRLCEGLNPLCRQGSQDCPAPSAIDLIV